MYEINGFDTPRIFVSARTGTGLPELRAHLAKTVQDALDASDNSEYDPRFVTVDH
jgi:50S ribosomal subunit-associated GTPase HflX